MGILLKGFERYFVNEASDELFIGRHRSFIDDLERWVSVCSAAFEKASFISATQTEEVYFISKSLLTLTGYSEDEAAELGANFLSKLVHPDDGELLRLITQCALNSLLSEERNNRRIYHTIRYNFRLWHKEGHWLNIECFLYPIYLINEKVHFSLTYASPSMSILPVSFQIYFPKENKRFIYNNRLHKFILEEKTALNKNELEVLKLTALGKREYEMAEMMEVEVNLIKYYKKSVLKKLSVYSMPEALYYALKQNLL